MRIGYDVQLAWRARLDPAAGNDVQGDSVTFGPAFALEAGIEQSPATRRDVVRVGGIGVVSSTPQVPVGTLVLVVAGVCLATGPLVARLARRRRPAEVEPR